MDAPPARRQSRVRIAAAAASALVALAIAGLWTQRTGLASGYIDAELARRGVPASYRITRFGIGGQRLENVRIGDPAHPDLTADHADVRIALGRDGPYLASVTAGGVRLRGRLVDGRVTLGAVDRLLPSPSGRPLALPDLIVGLRDAALRLETDGGPLDMRLAGSGLLSDGFSGDLAVAARDLRVAGCRILHGQARLAVAIAAGRPALDGPAAADRIVCAGATALAAPAATVDVALGPALDRWTGGAFLDAAAARSGQHRLGRLAGRIGFDGSAAATTGTLTLGTQRLATVGLTAGRTTFDGRYRVGPAIRLRGTVRTTGAALDPAIRARVAAGGGGGAGTPLGPVIRAVAAAAARAGAAFDAGGDIDFARTRDGMRLRLARVAATAAGGARFAMADDARLTIDPTTGGTQVDGRLRLGGGGLPSVDAALHQAGLDGPVAGVLRVAPYRAGGAAARLSPVRFRMAAGATRFGAVATMDGPVAGGRVDGLVLPIVGRLGRGGSFVVDPACVPLTFDRLALAGLRIGRTRATLCPGGGALLSRSAGGAVRGGGRIAAPLLVGTLGGAPVRIGGRALSFDLGGPDFRVDGLAMALGPAAARTLLLDIARFAGTFGGGGVGGRFDGLAGQILAVPLRLGDGTGAWRLAGGTLRVASDSVALSDMNAEPRFNPLISNDFTLTLQDNRIMAGGALHLPDRDATITQVSIGHDLGTGAGQAHLAVPGVGFDPAFQPERLTRLTLGIVANVKGLVTGAGDIAWDRRGVTSRGTFATESLDMAAAFGPVSGVRTRIVFDDLLNLKTAPGQQATVAEVNPGIAVRDGTVRYQLLPGQRVAVEGGRWPLAGGTLTLDPTLLDFSGAKDRRMTFRVDGMDAAQFVQQFGFDNIAVTGTFDGVMPMVFDDHGGRIGGGRLSVRPEGGTLAYVGEVSNARLGMFGSLAFDALKRMRYRALTILLDGALDGELVSQVRFDGTNQTPREAIRRNGLLSAFANLPFRFNIVIRAPFRGLLNSAQSLNDPRGLIRQAMPPTEPLPGSAAVQPQESESVR